MTARVDAQALAASLRRLQERDTAVLQPSLRRIVDACAQLFGLDGSGVMLADEQGVLRFVVTTDGAGRELEDAQRDAGQGPCLTRSSATSRQLREHSRRRALPGAGCAAARRDRRCGAQRSAAAVPHRRGHVNVHTVDPRRWSRAERDALSRYGEIAEAMLSAAVSADQAGELAAQLNYALDYRAPIERGVGYLMARDGLDQAAAFHRLRTAARSNRRRIGEVAEELLRSGRLPGEGD